MQKLQGFIMVEPSLRIKVTDFLATNFEQDIFQELMRIKQLPEFQDIGFPLYFWYDRKTEVVDLNTLEQFITYWKSSGEYATKLVIYPELFDSQNDFIWYDIRPHNAIEYIEDSNLSYIQHYRFSCKYTDPKTGILEGLKDFQEKFIFVNRDNSSDTPRKKQKRNDDENSNHR